MSETRIQKNTSKGDISCIKALIYKDISYLQRRSYLYLLVIMVIISIVPFLCYFANFYAAALICVPFFIDERTQWRRTAAFMPYTVRDIVLARYIMSYGFLIVLLLFVNITALFLHYEGDSYSAPGLRDLVYCNICSVGETAFMIPILFRNKAKGVGFFLSVGGVSLLPALFQMYYFAEISDSRIYGEEIVLVFIAIALAVIIPLSYIYSKKVYKNTDKI